MSSLREGGSAWIRRLPERLFERVRVVCDRPVAGGAFVLYWMRAALRAHDNPALEAALAAAEGMGLPLLVYQGVSERYPYASDRIHRFLLEGHRSAALELRERGLSRWGQVTRPGHRGKALAELGRRAALIVTDELPVPFMEAWLGALGAATAAPLWAVDASCIVPLPAVGRAYERAYEFRRATAAARARGLAAPPFEAGAARPLESLPELDEAPLDLATLSDEDIDALIAACDIDHSVGPVPETRGGAAAGYERWQGFCARGLAVYDKVRNDATRDGTSRLSAYLHFGMVSPFRLAREAKAMGGSGPEKWLDEMLVWRELAWSWCAAARPAIPGLGDLPGWAQRELEAHAGDPREVKTLEALGRGRSGHELWDLAQTSLLRHGELHNNLRMTWGKAIPLWSRDPAQACARLFALNDRYALDGRDPNSFGGLLWCLGLFDRPFDDPSPVLGRIRGRSLDSQQGRISMTKLRARIERPAFPEAPKVAVVGAGISGLLLARTLQDHGLRVDVFDKGRRPGGRLSTRVHARDGAPADEFDHGAQFFTATRPALAPLVESWASAGLIAPWEGRFRVFGEGSPRPEDRDATRWVGVPDMSALTAHIAADLSLSLGARVDAITGAPGAWTLRLEGGEARGSYGLVLLSAPSPQTATLAAPVAPELAARAQAAEMVPCWALMLASDAPLELDFDAARIADDAIAWCARNSAKPGRPSGETWVVHASPSWSEAHLELDREAAAARLLGEFERWAGVAVAPARATAHRWRYAVARGRVEGRCLFDVERGLGACGDWCAGPSVEAAVESAMALSGRVMAALSRG